jgi:hypothetical protein
MHAIREADDGVYLCRCAQSTVRVSGQTARPSMPRVHVIHARAHVYDAHTVRYL